MKEEKGMRAGVPFVVRTMIATVARPAAVRIALTAVAPAFVVRTIITTLALACAAAPAAAQRPLKVFISADMEGVTGAVTPEQLGPSGFEYARFREFMTGEVLAAIAGAREAGATEIVVADAHGNAQNLLIERFPPEVRVVRSWPRPLGMMQGIDSTFHAALFIGYHAATTNPAGVRAHTFSSANYAGVKLNGRPISEAGLNAAIAGHFGVPVVLVSGDDVVVAETRALLGDVEGAVVKEALSFHSATTLTPQAGQDLIRRRTAAALRRLSDFRPHRLEEPVSLELTFKSYRPAEMLAYLPIVQRVDAHTVGFRGADVLEVSRFLQFVGGYEAGLEP